MKSRAEYDPTHTQAQASRQRSAGILPAVFPQ
jgi:hypothetical protein